MFVRVKSILVITSALLLTSPAHANPKMDINGDDEISRIEYMSYRTRAFEKEDKNFDGRLTKKEIGEASIERLRDNRKRTFEKMDINGDGHVTEVEHADGSSAKNNKKTEAKLNKGDKWFSRVDKDKNGHISRLEFDVYNERQALKAEKKNQKSSRKSFTRLDLDKDGIITELEFVDKGRRLGSKTSKKDDPLDGLYAHETASPKKRMRRDGNSDGVITKRENREFFEYYFEKHDKNKDSVITKKEAAHLFRDYEGYLLIP